VGVVLGDVIFEDPAGSTAEMAAVLLRRHFACPNRRQMTRDDEIDAGLAWWLENREDLCRRAKQLPK
jgi:hypothetical protein